LTGHKPHGEGNPMPEFTIKELRLPELHLPEIKRDEIVRSLSGVRLPEVDLAKARRASIKVPAVTVSSSDVGKVVAAAAALVRFVRPAPARVAGLPSLFGRRTRSPLVRIVQPRRRRSRWPLAIGGILVVALAAWAVIRRPGVRERIDSAARDARLRIEDLRNGNGTSAIELHAPTAMTTTEAAEPLMEAMPATPSTEERRASSEGSMAPAFEETASPA
jgi:hypothetical protein